MEKDEVMSGRAHVSVDRKCGLHALHGPPLQVSYSKTVECDSCGIRMKRRLPFRTESGAAQYDKSMRIQRFGVRFVDYKSSFGLWQGVTRQSRALRVARRRVDGAQHLVAPRSAGCEL